MVEAINATVHKYAPKEERMVKRTNFPKSDIQKQPADQFKSNLSVPQLFEQCLLQETSSQFISKDRNCLTEGQKSNSAVQQPSQDGIPKDPCRTESLLFSKIQNKNSISLDNISKLNHLNDSTTSQTVNINVSEMSSSIMGDRTSHLSFENLSSLGQNNQTFCDSVTFDKIHERLSSTRIDNDNVVKSSVYNHVEQLCSPSKCDSVRDSIHPGDCVSSHNLNRPSTSSCLENDNLSCDSKIVNKNQNFEKSNSVQNDSTPSVEMLDCDESASNERECSRSQTVDSCLQQSSEPNVNQIPTRHTTSEGPSPLCNISKDSRLDRCRTDITELDNEIHDQPADVDSSSICQNSCSVKEISFIGDTQLDLLSSDLSMDIEGDHSENSLAVTVVQSEQRSYS